MPFRMKRVYDPPAEEDGFRVLIDRLWPRGVSRKAARLDLWLKDAAPSSQLRRWFGHESSRWPEFRKRYYRELRQKRELLEPLLERARTGIVTLVFSARAERLSNAAALLPYLRRRLRPRRDARRPGYPRSLRRQS